MFFVPSADMARRLLSSVPKTMANHNWEQNNNNEENRWREPSAEPREPQLNRTICGCDCRVRGFIVGDAEGGGRGDEEDSKSKVC